MAYQNTLKYYRSSWSELPKLCSGLILAFCCFLGTATEAETFVVKTMLCDASDSFPCDGKCLPDCEGTSFCNLRAALQEAQCFDDADTITFDVGGRVNLESILPTINKDLTIRGPGATVLDISANGDFRVFDIDGREITDLNVNISGLRIINGGPVQEEGGGIRIRGDRTTTVNISRAIIAGNNAFAGGGVYNGKSNLRITDTIIRNNGARLGGGVYNYGGKVSVDNSVIHDNRADTFTFTLDNTPTGGGIYNYSYEEPPAEVAVTNSTITNNIAHTAGGILNQGSVTAAGDFSAIMSIANGTVSHNNGGINFQGGGITVDGPGTLTLKNTIIAYQGATGGDCFIPSTTSHRVVSLGNNLDSDGSCTLTMAEDLPGVKDPLLGPLEDNFTLNGTQTRALLTGSPAIDSGSNDGCPSIDQRGRPRPEDGNGDQIVACDIGAYEVQSDEYVAPLPDQDDDSGGGGSFDPTFLSLFGLVAAYFSRKRFGMRSLK